MFITASLSAGEPPVSGTPKRGGTLRLAFNHDPRSLDPAFVFLNCELPPFTNRLVRQAMNYAVNKEAFDKLLLYRGARGWNIVGSNDENLR